MSDISSFDPNIMSPSDLASMMAAGTNQSSVQEQQNQQHQQEVAPATTNVTTSSSHVPAESSNQETKSSSLSPPTDAVSKSDASRDRQQHICFLRLRGLPFTATETDVKAFYSVCMKEAYGEAPPLHDGKDTTTSSSSIVDGTILGMVIISTGHRRGEAHLILSASSSSSHDVATRAAKALHTRGMNSRYVEAYASSRASFEDAEALAASYAVDPGNIVRLRGLPYTAGDAGVRQFFAVSPTGSADPAAFVNAVNTTNNSSSSSNTAAASLPVEQEGATATAGALAAAAAAGAPEGETEKEKQQQQQQQHQTATSSSGGGLADCITEIVHTVNGEGQNTGDAFVRFNSEAAAKEALTYHRNVLGHRYVEVVPSSAGERDNVLMTVLKQFPMSSGIARGGAGGAAGGRGGRGGGGFEARGGGMGQHQQRQHHHAAVTAVYPQQQQQHLLPQQQQHFLPPGAHPSALPPGAVASYPGAAAAAAAPSHHHYHHQHHYHQLSAPPVPGFTHAAAMYPHQQQHHHHHAIMPAAAAPPARSYPVIRLRGLPWSANEQQIADWLMQERDPLVPGGPMGRPVRVPPQGVHLIFNTEGRHTGSAFVEVEGPADVEAAMQLHRQMFGSRYIEVFRSSQNEMKSPENVGGRESCFGPAPGETRPYERPHHHQQHGHHHHHRVLPQQYGAAVHHVHHHHHQHQVPVGMVPVAHHHHHQHQHLAIQHQYHSHHHHGHHHQHQQQQLMHMLPSTNTGGAAATFQHPHFGASPHSE